MGSFEVVFHEPLGEIWVKDLGISMEVTELDELFLQGSVEPLECLGVQLLNIKS